MLHTIQHLSQLTLLSVVLLILSGCGEKRVHVATSSGAPGEEMTEETTIPTDFSFETSGLSDSTMDESSLAGQPIDGQNPSSTSEDSNTNIEPVHSSHSPMPSLENTATANLQDTEGISSDSPGSGQSSSPSESLDQGKNGTGQDHPTFSTLEAQNQESADHQSSQSLAKKDSSNPFTPGQDFSTQSSSGDSSQESIDGSQDNSSFLDLAGTDPSETHDGSSSNLQFSSTSAPADEGADGLAHSTGSTEGQDGMEHIPGDLVVAKVNPSDSLQDQLDRIQGEELASAAAGLEDIFFLFDSWSLTQEGKNSLERNLAWLEADESTHLLIEGHTDQRGTQAYNMVLGERRAVSIRDYLAQLGIAPSRLKIISYGKDKPFCQDLTEVCHQLNRRGHLLVQQP